MVWIHFELLHSNNNSQFHTFWILQVNTIVLICRGMKRRDLLLRRYWRREDDGTYGTSVSGNMWISSGHESQLATDFFSCCCFTVILYHSVYHRKCLPESGAIRALLKSNVCFELQTEKWYSLSAEFMEQLINYGVLCFKHFSMCLPTHAHMHTHARAHTRTHTHTYIIF